MNTRNLCSTKLLPLGKCSVTLQLKNFSIDCSTSAPMEQIADKTDGCRQGDQGYSPSYAQAIFGRRKDPHCAGWPAWRRNHCRALPDRRHCPELYVMYSRDENLYSSHNRYVSQNISYQSMATKVIPGLLRFGAFLGRSPDSASEDIRRFQLHLSECGMNICNRNRTMTSLRLLFRVTLGRLDLVNEIYTSRSPRRSHW